MNVPSMIAGNGASAIVPGNVERLETIELARGLAKRELMPLAAALDGQEQEAIASCWRTICEVGLDRALLPEEHGGIAMKIGDLLSVIGELAVGDGGIALSVLLSNAALASLPATTAAKVPPGARWTVVPVGREAARPGGLSLLGLGAHGADGILLAFPCERERKTGPSERRDSPQRHRLSERHDPCCSEIYVTSETEGLSLKRDDDQLGLRGAPAASIELARVPREGTTETGIAMPENRGAMPENRGATISPAGIGGGEVARICLRSLLRHGAAAIARGIALRAEEIATEYALSREQGGVKIVCHDAVSDMLGAMAVRRRSISTATSDPSGGIGQEVASAVNGEGEVRRPTSASEAFACSEAAIAAKISATEAAIATCTDAVQVFGGTGYMKETGAEKLMRDAMTISLFPEPSWVALGELYASFSP